MNKTAKLCLVGLSSLVLLCSCSDAPTQSTSENFEIAQNEFTTYTFEYPKDWTVIRNDAMISVKSSEEDPKEAVTISCAYWDVNPKITVNDYWYGDGTEENPGYYQKLREALGGKFTEINEDKEDTESAEDESIKQEKMYFGNTPYEAIRMDYTVETPDGTRQFSEVVAIISEQSRAYHILYTSLPEYHDNHEADFTHAVSTFTLK